MALRTNVEIWNGMRVKYPNFGSITAEATADTFTEKGYTAFKKLNNNLLSDFFGLLVRVAFQRIDLADSKDYFDEIGYGETFENSRGGVIQRIAVSMLKGTSPKFKNLKDGDAVNPFLVRKPKVAERFFDQNFDYQNYVSIQEFDIKLIFLDEYGFDSFMTGIVSASLAGYAEQKYLAKLECVNEIINSTEFPLQDTQKIEVTFADPEKPTVEEYRDNFIVPIQTLIDSADAMSSTDGFNSYGFRTKFEKDKIVMLVRSGFMESVNANVPAYAFNDSYLKLPIEYHVVNDFGGLVPYKEAEFTTQLYPVYDKTTGEMIGYAEEDGAEEATVKEGDVYMKDPNADVIALISDKRSIFHAIQNPITMFPHVNGAGLYTTYWQSSPDNSIKYDPIYTNIVVKKKTV